MIRALSAVGALAVAALVAFTSPAAAAPSPPPPRSPYNRLGYGVQVPVYARPVSAQRQQDDRRVAPSGPKAALRAGTAAATAQTDTVVGDASTFEITYEPASAQCDTTPSPEVRDAFDHAAQALAAELHSTVPITVDVCYTDQGDPFLLGSAGPDSYLTNSGNNTAYPIALVEAVLGQNLKTGGAYDIDATFNRSFANWYFGTDGNPGDGSWDFETVALHELTHGMGFVSSFTADGDETGGGRCPLYAGCWGAYPADATPFVFDRYMVDAGSGGATLFRYGDGTGGLYSALTSGSVYWDGTNGTYAGGGARPRLFAPSPWEPGSSASHLDESTYTTGTANALMTPIVNSGEVIHAPGQITDGMLADLGWTSDHVTAAWGRYIDAVYQDLLGRPPSDTYRSRYLTQLEQAALTPLQLTTHLATAAERVQAIVAALYQSAYGGPGSSQNLATWTQRITSGQATLADTAGAIYGAAQAFAHLGGNDLTTWVRQLYVVVLGRASAPPADDRNVGIWVSRARQWGRPYVAEGMYQSAEAGRFRADALYQKFFHQPPSPSSSTAWGARMISDGELSVAAQMTATDKYYGLTQQP